MIVLLSPAKTLDEDCANPALKPSDHTRPELAEEAEELVGELKKLPVGKLKALLGVSDAIARLNHERYRDWKTQPCLPAATLFDGPAYRELRAAELTAKEIKSAAQQLRILCGLYGVLRPWDAVKPYRLDMSKKLANRAGKDLYAFWADKLAGAIQRDLEAQPSGQRFIVNCASQEYFQSVKPHLTCPVYTMQFPGPSVYAKQARGAMVRYILTSGAKTPEDLKGFTGNSGEWKYDSGKSKEFEFVFQRSQVAAGSKKRKR
eukprot:jgi/Tetstr1/433492/TSEL_022762.t1